MSRAEPAALTGELTSPAARGATGTRRLPLPVAALALADLVALATAVAVAGRVSPAAVSYVPVVAILLAAAGTLRLRICLRLSDQAGRILTAVAGGTVLLLPWLPADRAWRLAAWSAGFVLVGRGVAYACVRVARRSGLLTEHVLIVGTGETGVLISRLLREHPELGLRAAGFAGPGPQRAGELPVLGSTADLPALIEELAIQRVIVCDAAGGDAELAHVLRTARRHGAAILLVPEPHELGLAVPRSCLDEIWGVPAIPLRPAPSAGLLLKRAVDVVVSAVLLCLLAPVILGFMAIIRNSSGAPAIFRQLRVTGAGRAAQILKLRTLEPHGNSDTCWSVPVETCTRFGRWLRVSHLDELPQLVNVLRGQMSLVGPRPERPYFADRFGRVIPGYRDRDRMRAGLTGLAQVSGLHGDTSLADRVRFDNQYIEYWSPWLDLVILVRTAARTIAGARGGKQ